MDRTIESSSTTITQSDFSAINGQPQTVIKVVTDSGFQIRTQTTTNVYPAPLCVNIHSNST